MAEKTVGEFYSRSQIQEREAFAKFTRSDALQEAFESAESFLVYCRARDRLERKWRNDAVLRARFKTPGDYVAEVTGMIKTTSPAPSDSARAAA